MCATRPDLYVWKSVGINDELGEKKTNGESKNVRYAAVTFCFV